MDIRSSPWTPTSWRDKPIAQAVEYEDKAAFKEAISELHHLPPLVTPHEINKLKSELREVALGNAFLLQGGDCAELFAYCNQQMIESKVKLLLQMSLVLVYGARKRVIRVARMAGQYAKPRSSPNETINGVSMPSFRGDILNSFEPDPTLRKPDPQRLVKAYHYSAATLNYLRSALASGIADLHAPLDWSLGHVLDPELRTKYQDIVTRITETLEMMHTVGVDTGAGLTSVDIFTSHEGLLLEYEAALTRLCKHPANAPQVQEHVILPNNPKSAALRARATGRTANGIHSIVADELLQSDLHRKYSLPTTLPPPKPSNKAYYNLSTHFIWIGDRTRQLTHAHTEYFRGIANPVGIKVGPSMPPADLVPLLDILNPTAEIGKIVLITRYGASKISACLPGHIAAVQASRHAGTVVWQCDPMHGNGITATTTPPATNGSAADGAEVTPVSFKTRRFSDILSELEQCLTIHRSQGSYLGGVHLELTGEPVTECVGGGAGLTEEDLSLNYTTFCDPRLNEKQALELAFLVAGFYRDD